MARGVRERGSRRASGLTRGGEVCRTRKRIRQAKEPASLHLPVSIHHIHRKVHGTTVWSTRKGGAGRARGVFYGTAGAKERACTKRW